MNILEFSGIVGDTYKTIEYLQNHNILRKTFICCRRECYIVKDKCSDGCIFKCSQCKKRKSICRQSFFEGSKLPLRVLFTILYFFAKNATITQTVDHLKGCITYKTVLQWFIYLREICSLYLIMEPEIVLGDTSIVHLDESYLGHRPKYFHCSWRGQQYILFGIIDTVTKKCIIELVPDAKHDTLIPIIRKHVPHGMTIYTDGAKMYQCLEEIGYVHETVIHSDEFVTEQGIHTNNIQNLWVNVKSKFKSMRGSCQSNIPFHLDEFIYRWNRKFDGDFFTLFLRDVARFYPQMNN